MARIRTIKPDAFTSDSLSSVPRGTRWTFAGLWTYADDAGRARDDARLVKAALYPIDDATTLEDVAEDLSLLAGIGAICRYIVDGKRYLHMPRWEHQKINRPTPAKSPPCPVHEDGGSGHVLDGDDSVNPHGALTEPSVGERKGKGKGKEAAERAQRVSEHLSRFDDFWDAYPRKLDRGHAEKAWAKIIKDNPALDSALVIDAAMRFASKTKGSDPKFIAYGATWLNGKRWLDEDVDLAADDGGWQTHWTPPEPPPEVADDPVAYQGWLAEQRKAAGR